MNETSQGIAQADEAKPAGLDASDAILLIVGAMMLLSTGVLVRVISRAPGSRS